MMWSVYHIIQSQWRPPNMNVTFDHAEQDRIRAALAFCPANQHNQVIQVLETYRFYAAMLESILDGYTRIEELNQDGLLVALTPEGRRFVEETLRHEKI